MAERTQEVPIAESPFFFIPDESVGEEKSNSSNSKSNNMNPNNSESLYEELNVKIQKLISLLSSQTKGGNKNKNIQSGEKQNNDLLAYHDSIDVVGLRQKLDQMISEAVGRSYQYSEQNTASSSPKPNPVINSQ